MPNPLDALEIKVPCQVPWEGMKGDERMRFCGQCRLNVYNLSEMSRKEAEALLQCSSGRVCVRLYRRPDGKVLTRSCRVVRGLRRARTAALSLVATVVMGFVAWASGAAAVGLNRGEGAEQIKQRQPFRTVCSWFETPTVIVGQRVMGDVCFTPPGKPASSPKGGS